MLCAFRSPVVLVVLEVAELGGNGLAEVCGAVLPLADVPVCVLGSVLAGGWLLCGSVALVALDGSVEVELVVEPVGELVVELVGGSVACVEL